MFSHFATLCMKGLKKTGYNVKVHQTLVSKWRCLYFYLKLIIKPLKIRKIARPLDKICFQCVEKQLNGVLKKLPLWKPSEII